MTETLLHPTFADVNDEDIPSSRVLAYSEEFGDSIVTSSFEHPLDAVAPLVDASPSVETAINTYYGVKEKIEDDPTAPLDLAMALSREVHTPLTHDQEVARDTMVLDALDGVTRHPELVTVKSLISGIEAIDTVTPENKKHALEAVETIMDAVDPASDPKLFKAAQITLEELPDNIETAKGLKDKVEVIADIETAKALNEIILKKQRRKSKFRAFIAKRFYRKSPQPEVQSEAELDEVMHRVTDKMLDEEKRRQAAEPTTGELSAEDLRAMAEIWDDDEDDEASKDVDAFIAAQLSRNAA